MTFPDFAQGAEAVRALGQSGLYPANCRLLDPGEAALTGASQDGALLVLGFESADHPVEPWMDRALELAADHGGTVGRRGGAAADGKDSVGTWREVFLRAPYLRDTFVACGVISETFETAVTWDRFEALHASVIEATERALAETCGGGRVMCRFTHVYPGRPGAVLHGARARPSRLGARAVGHDQGRGLGGDHRRRAARSRITTRSGGITGRGTTASARRRSRTPCGRPSGRSTRRAVLNPGVLIDP